MKKILIFCIILAVSLSVSCFKNEPTDITKTFLTTNEVKELFPAYQNTSEGKRWGYIDNKGNFIIKPQYKLAYDFNDKGVAIVSANVTSSLEINIIDKKGNFVSGPFKNSYLSELTKPSVFHSNNKSYIVDSSGKVMLESAYLIDDYAFSENMVGFSAVSGDKKLFGYLDIKGNVVISPKFTNIQSFKGGQAVVTNTDNTYSLINAKGEILKTSKEYLENPMQELSSESVDSSDTSKQSELTSYYDKATQKYGFKDKKGNIVIKSKFDAAREFVDDFAAVSESKTGTNSGWGIIAKTGIYVVNPEAISVVNLGKGIFLAGKKAQEDYYGGNNYSTTPKALVDKTGKYLSDYIYYDCGEYKNGYAYVADKTSTYLLNSEGKIDSSFPKMSGIGTLAFTYGLIKADIEGELSYYNLKGELVWKGENLDTVEGLVFKDLKYRPNIGTLVSYPEFQNIENKAIKDKINSAIKSLFVDSIPSMVEPPADSTKMDKYGNVLETDSIRFSVEKNKNLLIVNSIGYMYPVGAPHGQPHQSRYLFDLTTGNRYVLNDLFKKGVAYNDKILSIIKTQVQALSALPEPYKEQLGTPGEINKDTAFTIQKDGIEVIYPPYELSSYARGFVTFKVPFGKIIDMIDDKGAFWNSFNKNIKNWSAVNLRLIEQEDVDKVVSAIDTYEKSIVEAVNAMNFEKVAPILLKDSPIYQEQKKLVDELGKKGIKENLVSQEVFGVGFDEEKGVFNAFVREEIGVKTNASSSFTNRKFNWMYSLKKDGDKYFLTKIEKW